MSTRATPPLGAASVVPDPARPGAVARVRLTVAYDGGAFHGFARQPGVTTVGGTLAAALARVLRVPDVELTCAGRTDTGVHAWGQVVSFDAPVASLEKLPVADLAHAVNRLCAPQVVVRDATEVDATFDARFSARGRRYRYTILNRPYPDPFLAATSWHVPAPLDVRAMAMACDPFIGEHDFSSFCRRPKPQARAGEVPPEVSLTRRVTGARLEQGPDGLFWFWIEANAFCHQMVRSITGTIVEVGRGKRRAGDVLGIIRARDRHAAGDLAPPQGLCLWEVRY
jgi:tRNA pseudouridine38-40 synthase